MNKQGVVSVVGSFIADISAYTPFFPKDGETVRGTSITTCPGGKGSNQATAAHRAGANVIFVAKTGNDFFSSIATEHYKNEKLDTKYIFKSNDVETGTAIIQVNTESGENRIIISLGANEHITEGELMSASGDICDSDVLLLQYEINKDIIFAAKKLAKEHGVLITVNPAPYMDMPDEFYDGIDFITPNETELEYMTGISPTSKSNLEKACKKLIDKGVKNVIVTLGKQGAYYYSKMGSLQIPTGKIKAVDTTGAGDCFNGAFCASIAEDISNKRYPDIVRAIKFANSASGVKITRRGTSPAMPYKDEILKSMGDLYGSDFGRRIQ